MAWQYGYFGTDGKFVSLDMPGGISFNPGKSSVLNNDSVRKVFYNTETGQSLPYADFKDGDPGANNNQAFIGLSGILHYLNTGRVPSTGDQGAYGAAFRQKKFLEKFIKYNGGWEVWNNYDGTKLPDGIAASQLVAGRPVDTEGNVLAGYDDAGDPIYTSKNDYAGIPSTGSPYDDALNAYYKDLYSMDPGTGGADMYGRLAQVYANQGQVQSTLADATYQQQALQQAQVVKQISDQVRSERMARLRAGMSTSQIANQDMQIMMANVTALNQQAAEANQARLEARTATMTAQDQAYLEYLNQANARGQVAMAGYATDAGNVAYQVQQYMLNNPGVSYASAYKAVTGQEKGN